MMHYNQVQASPTKPQFNNSSGTKLLISHILGIKVIPKHSALRCAILLIDPCGCDRNMQLVNAYARVYVLSLHLLLYD